MNLLQPSFLTSILVLSFLVACQSHAESDRVPGDGQEPLVAASNMLHPPFSSRDASGRPVGIEVELIDEAARVLGREVRWIDPSFSELIPSVVSRKADIAASTIGITEERRRLVAFTEPYFTTTIVALVRPGPSEPTSLSALRGRRVATERGTTAIGAARKRIPEAIRVLDRERDQTWGQMLQDRKIDAIILDRSHAPKFIADAGLALRMLEEPLQEEHFALAVAKDAGAILEALNRAIASRGHRQIPR